MRLREPESPLGAAGTACPTGATAPDSASLAHRIVWVDPQRGKTGFAPLTGGMLAALPVIDELVAGHSFEALRSVAEVTSRA